ncbi:hypothetical protein GGF32_009300 [Allomyces javanicus]|nr:hypothetical protein GGF32_009300 [Allomyces javanicus]
MPLRAPPATVDPTSAAPATSSCSSTSSLRIPPLPSIQRPLDLLPESLEAIRRVQHYRAPLSRGLAGLAGTPPAWRSDRVRPSDDPLRTAVAFNVVVAAAKDASAAAAAAAAAGDMSPATPAAKYATMPGVAGERRTGRVSPSRRTSTWTGASVGGASETHANAAPRSSGSNRTAWDRRRLSVEVDPTLAQHETIRRHAQKLTTMCATIARHKSLAAKMGHAALAATPPTILHRPDPLLASAATDDVGMTASMSTATQAAMALLARHPDDSETDDWATALQAVARRKSVAGPMGADRQSDTLTRSSSRSAPPTSGKLRRSGSTATAAHAPSRSRCSSTLYAEITGPRDLPLGAADPVSPSMLRHHRLSAASTSGSDTVPHFVVPSRLLDPLHEAVDLALDDPEPMLPPPPQPDPPAANDTEQAVPLPPAVLVPSGLETVPGVMARHASSRAQGVRYWRPASLMGTAATALTTGGGAQVLAGQ